jgi:predicted nucleic-acid-binding protein
MIGLDTNVLVRFIMQDDVRQSAKATRLLETLTEAEPGYVKIVAVLELVWVLSASYELSRTQVAAALEAVLGTRQLRVEQSQQVIFALRVYSETKADFADCLLTNLARAGGCKHTWTFDVGAAKHAGMQLIT